MAIIQRIALVLTIIGAINWGLIGFFEFDLVAYLFGGQTAIISRVIYGLVGIAGLDVYKRQDNSIRFKRINLIAK